MEAPSVIAAVYARKSNDQDVAAETKSVARQVEHARAYAARKGWVVSDEFVFVDDGISGAEFANRPGFVRLMAAVKTKPRPPFGVLVMSEESRLGREMIEVSYALKQIVTSGVRVFFYLEDRERTLSSPTDKILLAVNSYAAEVEREMARQRARDAGRQRAAHGFVEGGRCFGFRNVRTGTGRVALEVLPEEAQVVRRIFELARDGRGCRRIAATLNAEGAPCPKPQRARPPGWVGSSVRAVLYRETYRGTLVWGKAQKRNAWGEVKPSRQPETQWERASAPRLRLVSEELWEAAHEWLRASRANYLRTTNGQLWGKPPSGIESKYLLTGMATCGVCGGGLVAYPRVHGRPGARKRVHCYACPRARVGVCRNDLEVPLSMADEAALAMMSGDVLSPAVVDLAIEKVVALLDGPPEDTAARRKQLTSALAKTERELANLGAAVANGDPPESLLATMRDRERTARDLRAQLAALDDGPVLRANADAIRAEARKALDDWRGLLGRHVATSRQLLRKLLDRERFVFSPKRQGVERWYEVSVTPSVERFLGTIEPLKKAVASPSGNARPFSCGTLTRSLRRAA